MPTTKPSELRKLEVADLHQRLRETKKEMMDMRFQSSIGQLEKSHRLGESKREVARIMTVLGEKSRGVEVVTKEKEAPLPKAKAKTKAPAAKAAPKAKAPKADKPEGEKPKRAPRKKSAE
jgi:large subunit ribosomal protein L29